MSLEGCLNMFILNERISDSYDCVIKEDFNPDFVELFGLDSYETGFVDGIIVTGILVGSAYLVYRLIKKELNQATILKFRRSKE